MALKRMDNVGIVVSPHRRGSQRHIIAFGQQLGSHNVPTFSGINKSGQFDGASCCHSYRRRDLRPLGSRGTQRIHSSQARLSGKGLLHDQRKKTG